MEYDWIGSIPSITTTMFILVMVVVVAPATHTNPDWHSTHLLIIPNILGNKKNRAELQSLSLVC